MGGRGGAFKRRRGGGLRAAGGGGEAAILGAAAISAMPGRPEDYEVLLTIGAGSYGKCRKVRRKADGKVRRAAGVVIVVVGAAEGFGGSSSARSGWGWVSSALVSVPL